MNHNSPTQQILEQLSRTENLREYLVLVYGRISQEMIISAISLTENKLKLENFHQAAITRTKIISAELLQNMLKHQIFNEKCLPYFILGFTDKSLRIITGNLLLKTTCDTLTHRIEGAERDLVHARAIGKHSGFLGGRWHASSDDPIPPASGTSARNAALLWL